MIDTALHYALLDVPRAATIWLALIALAVVALAGLLTRPGRERAEDAVRIREAARRSARLAVEARDLRRYAEEVAVAAERAAATARRHRDEWLKADAEAEAAWAAFDRAESAARRLAAEGSFRPPRTSHTPAEYADRERFLHRAVMNACWNGELSILDLSDAMAHRGGWDPRRHPVEQEAFLRRMVRARALAAHREASARERDTWHIAQVSAAAAESLRREAAEAAERARQRRRAEPVAEVSARRSAKPSGESVSELSAEPVAGGRRGLRRSPRFALGLRTKSRWA